MDADSALLVEGYPCRVAGARTTATSTAPEHNSGSARTMSCCAMSGGRRSNTGMSGCAVLADLGRVS